MKKLSTKRKRHSDKKARKGSLPAKPRRPMDENREAFREWRFDRMIEQFFGWSYKSGP